MLPRICQRWNLTVLNVRLSQNGTHTAHCPYRPNLFLVEGDLLTAIVDIGELTWGVAMIKTFNLSLLCNVGMGVNRPNTPENI